jgi:hypothetical protein
MATRFLSENQRRRYGRYAGEPSEEQLAATFTSMAPTARPLRCCAVPTIASVLRCNSAPFAFSACSSTTSRKCRVGVVLDVAHQLGEDETVDLAAYGDGRQRWRHVALIRERHGFRDFAEEGMARFRLARWLYK